MANESQEATARPPLSKDEIAKIEAGLSKLKVGYVTLPVSLAFALCQTVKKLREDLYIAENDAEVETRRGDNWERRAKQLGREVEAQQAKLKGFREAAVKAAAPYEALLMDSASRKWIAPEVWTAIEEAVAQLRAALHPEQEQEGK